MKTLRGPVLFAAFSLCLMVCATSAQDHITGNPEPMSVAENESRSGRESTAKSAIPELRSLQESGITVALTYRGEIFRSVGLSPENVTRYRGLSEVALSLDTEKLKLWPDGELFVKGQNGQGQFINVTPGGVTQPLSNIDAQDFTQVSQYGLRQSFFSGILRADAGKRDANAIFCVNRLAVHFINPSYTLVPTVPMPTFPAPALGSALFFEPVKRVVFGLGAYDGAPKIGGLERRLTVTGPARGYPPPLVW